MRLIKITINFFSALRTAADRRIDVFWNSFAGMPWYLKYLTLTCFLVLTTPLGYLARPVLYSNTPFASLFFKEDFIYNNLLFITHIIFAIPALMLGPFLIDAATRKKHLAGHRKLGTWYIVCCVLSALTVIPLALSNSPDTLASYGFTPMAIIWFFTSFFAYTAARNKDFVAHRRWILRSYAMTYAFVHVNFSYKFYFASFYFDLPMGTQKIMQSMLSWQSNLLFIEIFLLLTTFKGRFVGWRNIRSRLHFFSPEDKFYFSVKKT